MGTFDGADWPGLAATGRSLPLDGVAAALGHRRDVTDGARWKRPGSVLRINGERFFNHMSGMGGGGSEVGGDVTPSQKSPRPKAKAIEMVGCRITQPQRLVSP